MLVDTGSTSLTVNESLAQRLLARGLAQEGPQGIATLADGSQREQQNVIIDTVTIGSHVLHDVLAGVSPDGSDMLLGLSVLNKIGRFTIDGANHKLIFRPMTPDELKEARRRLGLSVEDFARAFGAHDGRTVRAWEHGERNGLPARIPRSVELLVGLALRVPEARNWLLKRIRRPASPG